MMKRPEKTKKSVNQSLICSPLFYVYLIATKCLNIDEKKKVASHKKRTNMLIGAEIEKERERKRPTNNRICCRSIFSCHFFSLALFLILSPIYFFFSCRYTLARFVSSLCVLSRFFQL